MSEGLAWLCRDHTRDLHGYVLHGPTPRINIVGSTQHTRQEPFDVWLSDEKGDDPLSHPERSTELKLNPLALERPLRDKYYEGARFTECPSNSLPDVVTARDAGVIHPACEPLVSQAGG